MCIVSLALSPTDPPADTPAGMEDWYAIQDFLQAKVKIIQANLHRPLKPDILKETVI